ncbi:MAG: hypothetical protein HDT43_05670 [Ruminococcaceae bacterium]|nr:hypothetical protein [Oscillospiraceae bacterium]
MTKNEFLDIMGAVDEDIIDSTLDISRMDTIVIPYKRTPVWKYLLYAAACIALVFTAGSAVRYFNGKVLLPNGVSSDSTSSDDTSGDASTESTSSDDISESSDSSESYDDYDDYDRFWEPDFIRGWNPDEITGGELVLGGSAVASKSELNGMTVSLILHDITKLPGEERIVNGFDYTDYWGAKDIVLYAKTDDGEKYIYDDVSWLYNDEERFIHSKCVSNGGTRLYQRKHPDFVVQYVDYDADNDAFIARFFNIIEGYDPHRTDENKISSFGIFSYFVDGIDRLGGVGFGYQTSGRFYRKSSSVFVDEEYGYELHFSEPANIKLVYPDKMPAGYEDVEIDYLRGWDPEKLKYDPYPEVGESAIVSTTTVEDMTVSIVMIGVQRRPGEMHRYYLLNNRLDEWNADRICIYVKHSDGRRMIAYFPPWDYTTRSVSLHESELFEGCIRLFRMEDDRYLMVMLSRDDPDSDPVPYYFFDLEIDEYTVYPIVNDELKYQASITYKDENGIRYSQFSLQPNEVPAEGLRVSDSFEYKGGTTFADPVYGYEITFDFHERIGTVKDISSD